MIGKTETKQRDHARVISPIPSAQLSYLIASLLCGLLCILVTFRSFFWSHFDLVSGDAADGRLCLALLEHWTKVFSGRAELASPNFFFPEPGVMGYSESLFLCAIPFSCLRALHVDRYLALEITVILLQVIGFTAMLCVLRRTLRLNRWIALAGASLFVVSNIYYLSFYKIQLISQIFVPVIAFLVGEYWQRTQRHRHAAARCYLMVAAALLSLLLFTSFYIGWFTVFFGVALVPAAAAVSVVSRRSFLPLREWVAILSCRKLDLFLASAVFMITFLPFLRVYVPAAARTGGRPFQEVLDWMALPLDFLNVTHDNLVWGGLARRIERLARPGTARWMGWPVLTIFAFLGSAGFCSRVLLDRNRGDREHERQLMVAATALAVSCLALWLTTVNFGNGMTLWWFVWKVVPGAAAIRGTARIDLILNIAGIVVWAIGLDLFTRRLTARSRGALLAFLALGLMAEQMNSRPTHMISRMEDAKRFSRVRLPPPACSYFYLSDPDPRLGLVSQTHAMLVAQQLGIPTVNGYSGWNPKGWGLTAVSGDRAHQASLWVLSNGLTAGLCGLDLASGAWTPVHILDEARYQLGQTVDFSSANAHNFTLGGWFGPEAGWGDWMLGEESELLFYIDQNGDGLMLNAEFSSLKPPSVPGVNTMITANGSRIAVWRIENGLSPSVRTAFIPRSVFSGGLLRITFTNDHVWSPLDLGLSNDLRRLSLAMHRLTIIPATPDPHADQT